MTEAGFATTRAIANSIGRCADSLLDVERLRGETNALKALSGELATFAGMLFELECAKKGDADARANLADISSALLQFWRDKSGDQLATMHPTLFQLWNDASAMLVAFEQKRFDRALAACFEVRGDTAALERALLELTPAGDRRVEFACCLYHLELTRLGVAGSRAEFARRITVVHEAYTDPQVAAELVGGDAGLQYLWKELIPYLDEFFEAQEQHLEKRKRETDPLVATVAPPPAPPASDPNVRVVPPPPPPLSDPNVTVVPPPAEFVSEAELLTSTETSDQVEILDPHAFEDPSAPPPPPPSLFDTLPPPPPPPPRPPTQELEAPVIELEEAPVPRPSRPLHFDVLVDYEPDAQAQAFWRHTEAALGLLPDPKAPRTGWRVLSADGRAERKKLNAWLDGMEGKFTEVPEARAMQCLMRLYMAAQVKEKGLFGGANPKRKDAFRAALGLLSAADDAAARAAVWFELDGPETLQHLQSGLEVVQDFLQFCAREKKDPLDLAAVDEFLG